MKRIVFFVNILILSAGLVVPKISVSQTLCETDMSPLVDSTNVVWTDSTDIDVNLLITEQPSLFPASKEGDTLRVFPKRYGNAIQVDTNGRTSISNILLLRTGRIGEFINRFNGDSATLALFNDRIDFTQRGKVSVREGHILSLCNRTDAISDSILLEFAKEMSVHPYFIDTERGSNYAAVVTLAYTDPSDNAFPVRLTLRQSEANHAPVWYVTQVESPYLSFGKEEKPYYIDYAEREIGFMGLARHTDRSASSIAGPMFEGDPLSAFLILTSKGFIKYKHSERTQFVFRIGSYLFLVEKVESFEHPRSGYLITRLMKDGKLVFENRPM